MNDSSVDTKHLQGKITPTLYVGLGGGGGDMVRHIFRKFDRDPVWRVAHRTVTSFLVIDTNKADLDKGGKLPIDSFLLADVGGAAAEDRRRMGDVPFERFRGGTMPRTSAYGAGQIRVEARTKLYLREQELRKELERLISKTIEQDDVYLRAADGREYRVHVFGTLGGGTCSGSFIPLPYLIRDIIVAKGWTPSTVGYFVHGTGLQGKDDQLTKYMMANSYAAICELEHLQREATAERSVEFAYRQPKTDAERAGAVPITVTRPPYDWLYLADSPDRDLARRVEFALADAAYIHIATPAAGSEAGQRDNYTRFMQGMHEKLSSTPQQPYRGVKYTVRWATAGSSCLYFPLPEFRAYITERVVADVLDHKIAIDGVSEVESPEAFSEEELRILKQRNWADKTRTEAIEAFAAKVRARLKATPDSPPTPGAGEGKDAQVYRVDGDLGEATRGQDEATTTGSALLLFEELFLEAKDRLASKSLEAPNVAATREGASESGVEAKFRQADREFDEAAAKDRRTMLEHRKRLESGKWLEELQDALGEQRRLNLAGQRYLLARLLGGYRGKDGERGPLDKEIAKLARDIEERERSSFALDVTDDPFARGVEDLKRLAQQAAPPTSFFRRLAEALNVGSDDVDPSAVNKTLQGWVSRSQELQELRFTLEALKGLQTFILRRLEFIEAIGKAAREEAAALVRAASRAPEPPFSVGVAALETFENESLWSEVYEDRYSAIWSELPSAAVESTVETLIDSEERSPAPNARLAVRTMVEHIRALAGKVVESSVKLSLADALRLEALCVQARGAQAKVSIPEDAAPALRKELERLSGAGGSRRERLAFLESNWDRDPALKEEVASYVRSKLRHAKALASPLAALSSSTEGTPQCTCNLTVITAHVERALEAMGTEATPVRLGTTIEGEGVCAHADDTFVYFFEAKGAMPIWKFEGNEKAYEQYDGVIAAGKPHMLSIDHAWEEKLPHVAVRYHADLDATRTRVEPQLVDLVKRGLVRVDESGSWTLALAERRDSLGDRAEAVVDAFLAWVEVPANRKLLEYEMRADTRAPAEALVRAKQAVENAWRRDPERYDLERLLHRFLELVKTVG